MTIKPITYWIGGSILTVLLVYGLWALRPLWMKSETFGDAWPPNPKQMIDKSYTGSVSAGKNYPYPGDRAVFPPTSS